MGTRNLTIVMHEGRHKIAQYGQWDGYPSGVGLTILSFLREEGNIADLTRALTRVRFLDEDGEDREMLRDYESRLPQKQDDPDRRTEEQRQWYDQFISRGIGGCVLENICESEDEEIILKDNYDFAGDSAFCEYAYVIDLDQETFEVFEGFNKEKIEKGRFVSGDPTLERRKDWQPVKLVKKYDLKSLPDPVMFLTDLDGT